MFFASKIDFKLTKPADAETFIKKSIKVITKPYIAGAITAPAAKINNVCIIVFDFLSVRWRVEIFSGVL